MKLAYGTELVAIMKRPDSFGDNKKWPKIMRVFG
jgi:hypothetical protein